MSMSKSTGLVARLTSGTIASESSIASAPQLMGLAISAWPKKPAIMFPLVKPTPTMKLVHTAAFEMRLEYRPHRKGPRKAPASAPQLMGHELRDERDRRAVLHERDDCGNGHERYEQAAHPCELTLLIHVLHDVVFQQVEREPCSTEVSTSELKVDIEAESTSTITRPTSKSGKVESIVGMMES